MSNKIYVEFSKSDEYQLLDSGDGCKLERFGNYTLVRPCSQALWHPALPTSAWEQADAAFDRSEGNRWHNRSALPDTWQVCVAGIRFTLSGTDFGHLGIFPEQRMQWLWIQELIKNMIKARGEQLQVLNLFAYSGGSTLAAALGGAAVCHLDASRGMVDWARKNAQINKLSDHPIRWIVDDAHKFMKREIQRGRCYDAIILDPPTFGRGSNKEIYKIERDLKETLSLCCSLLSPNPLFILLSAHTPGFSPVVLQNILGQSLSAKKGSIEGGEMLLCGSLDTMPLPNGAFARWSCATGNHHTV